MTAPRLTLAGGRVLRLLVERGPMTADAIVAAYPAFAYPDRPGAVVANRSGLTRTMRLLARDGYAARAGHVWDVTAAGRSAAVAAAARAPKGRTCAVCGRGGVGGWTLGYRPAPNDRDAVFAHPGTCAQEAVRQGLVSMPGDRKPQEPTS